MAPDTSMEKVEVMLNAIWDETVFQIWGQAAGAAVPLQIDWDHVRAQVPITAAWTAEHRYISWKKRGDSDFYNQQVEAPAKARALKRKLDVSGWAPVPKSFKRRFPIPSNPPG